MAANHHHDAGPCPVCTGPDCNLVLVPDLPDLPPLPIGALAAGVVSLLHEAATLPQPSYITMCTDTKVITVEFDELPASCLRALTRWALRFGAVVVSEPCHDGDTMTTYCHTEFSYLGVAVIAYAFVPAPPGATCTDPSCGYCSRGGNRCGP